MSIGLVARIVVVLLGVAWLGWTPVRSMYLDPRAETEQRRVKFTAEVNRYRAGTDDHVRVRAALQSYVDRTLGGDLETVDHELRTVLLALL